MGVRLTRTATEGGGETEALTSEGDTGDVENLTKRVQKNFRATSKTTGARKVGHEKRKEAVRHMGVREGQLHDPGTR